MSQCPCGRFCFLSENQGKWDKAQDQASQCPCGRFCFLSEKKGRKANRASILICRNALAGVFVFSQLAEGTIAVLRIPGRNALAGVFVFSPK